MIWILIIVCFVPGLYAQPTARTKFSCEGRVSGYYADVDSGCQIYHMCDGLGRQFSYSCPNTTLFQQRMLICDHWYMVNCSTSEVDYSANLLIGQREKLFVDDNDEHPYHRTPRPDLLSHPSEHEFNIIYRTGRAHLGSNLNLVGVDSDYDQNNDSSTTDHPKYFLPSHWSTEYSKSTTTQASVEKQKFTNTQGDARKYKINNKNTQNIPNESKKILDVKIKPKTEENTEIPVNFKSYFKNTTPSYPKVVITTPHPSDDEIGLLPPPAPNDVNSNVHIDRPPITLDFLLRPNSPNGNRKIFDQKTVDESTEETTTVPVNFKSYFKNTTPSFPKTVETTPSLPADEIGLLPPRSPNESGSVSSNSNTSPPGLDFLFRQDVSESNNRDFNRDRTESTESTELIVEETTVPVNFKSYFKNTTPSFPKTVETTPSLPADEIGLLPPLAPNNNITNVDVPTLSLDFLPPPPDNSHLTRNHTEEEQTITPPSKFYQPPFFEPDYSNIKYEASTTRNVPTISPLTNDKVITRTTKSPIVDKNWKDLREVFLIPDYDFPLDSVSRPSYDSAISSFQVKPIPSSSKK